MGKVFTLLTAFLLLFTGVQAAPPTQSSSGINVGTIEGNRFYLYFTTPSSGGGTKRIIIMKAGSAIDFTDANNLPENGINYTANSVFGTAGTEFKTTGGYVIYDNTAGSGLLITGLSPATTYHIAIFEYNGTGVTTEYRMVPAVGTGTTVSAPTQQSSGFYYTNKTGDRMIVGWTGGNGSKTLIIARKGADPVSVPADLTNYTASANFGTASSRIGATDEFVIYDGINNSFWLDGLEPNTTYHFAFYEANGSSRPVYLRPGAFSSQTTIAGPSTKPGNPQYSSIGGNRFSLNFSPSDATRYLVIARQGAAPTFVPTNGTTVYTGSTAFGSGTEVAPGEFVISAGTTYSLGAITNLLPGTSYYFKVYGYDATSAGYNYYLTTLTGNSVGTTINTPTDQAAFVSTTVTSGTSMRMDFTKATTGAEVIILVKAGSAVDANPVDFTSYTSNYNFGYSGSQIGTGNYVVYADNTTNVTIYGLTAGVNYHYALYAYNGDVAPMYRTPGVTGSFIIPFEPSAPASNMVFNSVYGNTMSVSWTAGTGARRIVIARKDNPVSAIPADFTTYTANQSFGSGQEIAAGEFVVYNGNANNVTVNNLEANTTYHFAAFEYNGTGATTDYRTSTFLAGSRATLAAPTLQVSNINANTVQDDRATITFTPGNGYGRLFVMKANTAVANTPVNFTNYNDHATFGSQSGSSYRIATGEYVVRMATNGTGFTVTGLAPNTTYHVAAFEYNGAQYPVFLTPGTTFSFTTTGPVITPTPTIESTAPTFSNIEGNSIHFNWTGGNGSNRIVVARAGSAPVGIPANGTTYAFDADFGDAAFGANAGEYVVYRGSGGGVTVTNLSPNTTYHFKIYEFNGTGATSTYLTSASLSASRSTATTPASGSTAAGATIPSSTSMRISWTNGPGANRLVVLKQGSAITGTPIDLISYASSSTFGTGSQLNLGEYIVYKASDNNVTISGLVPGQTYHYRIFDYNGSAAPVYNIANSLSGSVVVTPLPLTWVSFSGRKGDNGFQLNWSTADEINTSHFDVERSEDGVAYTVIATIAAKGAGSTNQYSYIDMNTGGKRYYRIKQVDIDGKSEYSKVVTLQDDNHQDKVLLYPNPAVKQVYIQVSGKATVRIYDANGRQVQISQLMKPAYLDVQSLKPGIYIVEVVEQHKAYKSRLIKG